MTYRTEGEGDSCSVALFALCRTRANWEDDVTMLRATGRYFVVISSESDMWVAVSRHAGEYYAGRGVGQAGAARMCYDEEEEMCSLLRTRYEKNEGRYGRRGEAIASGSHEAAWWVLQTANLPCSRAHRKPPYLVYRLDKVKIPLLSKK